MNNEKNEINKNIKELFLNQIEITFSRKSSVKSFR